MDNAIIVKQVNRDRQAQGLPPKVADAVALRKIAALTTARKAASDE